MLIKLIFLFTIVPLVELWLLIKIGTHIGALNTVVIVIVTGVLGATLAKYEGLKVVNKIKSDLDTGKIPQDSIIEGVLILGAALLLVTPGLLTDIAGFCVLVPVLRRWIRDKCKVKMREHVDKRKGTIDINSYTMHD